MKYSTKNLTLSAAVAFALATMGAGLAQAQEVKADATAEAAPAPEAKPDHEISFNVAVTSDYRYRGISQTRLKPAVQGGADYVNNPTGLYVGTWLSTIKWIEDAGGDNKFEWDVYFGKRGELPGGFTYDVGFLAYLYPDHSLPVSPTTKEIYVQGGYGPVTLKYSHAISNLFGFADTKNSTYVDGQFNYEITDGYIFNAHVGHQKVKNLSSASYTDWKLGVTKDFGFVTVSLAYVDTNAEGYVSPFGKDLGKKAGVLLISKTF